LHLSPDAPILLTFQDQITFGASQGRAPRRCTGCIHFYGEIPKCCSGMSAVYPEKEHYQAVLCHGIIPGYLDGLRQRRHKAVRCKSDNRPHRFSCTRAGLADLLGSALVGLGWVGSGVAGGGKCKHFRRAFQQDSGSHRLPLSCCAVHPLFSCLSSFCAAVLSANAAPEPSSFSRMARASADRPTRSSAAAR